jgi:hypothetical protein
MSALEQIAFYRNRRDEVPNQELAGKLAAEKDTGGIAEIAANLTNTNRNVASDCLKVLYEVGYLDPALIAPHVEDLLTLLSSRHNRMVWGAMIGIASVADLRPKEIWKRIDAVIDRTENGTVITFVWGIRALAQVASAKKEYAGKIVPKLLGFLASCNPRDIPTHLESMLCLIDVRNRDRFLSVVESRMAGMTPSHLSRLRKVTRKIEALGKA